MQLQKFRKQIDEIDQEIIKLLAKRLDVVQEIAKYKKEKLLSSLQPARWQEVLDSRIEMAKKLELKEDFIKNIWEEFHRFALELEDEIIKDFK